jgi:peptidoglycan/xylan/chitin deacetylase (PgdA/CDA1 family)
MKRKLLPVFFFAAILFFTLCKLTISYAQTITASDSADSTVVTIIPTLFPTITPTPSVSTPFPILDQLNELATPTATPSPTPTASPSGVPTPDIIASGSAQDYCLNIPVILYHHTEPLEIATELGHASLTEDSTYFEEHIRYLSQHGYHFLPLDELVHAILTRGTVPDKSVVITVDDGYIDAYTYAFMMAKKYHAVINFMVPTGLVGQPDYMTWDHLKEMAANPYARIYNHTTTHAALGLITQDQIIQEVTTANNDLKNNLGIKDNIVIYPYGSYNDLAIQTLRQLGMIAAVSTDPGTDECLSNIMKLPRVRVGNEPIEDYGY